MNPLTLVKRIQNINKKEATLGISEEASWHVKYEDSAYVYVGGIPFDLIESVERMIHSDRRKSPTTLHCQAISLQSLLSLYGKVADVNLVRDKGTGKSKAFSFLAYEDQRSTNLAGNDSTASVCATASATPKERGKLQIFDDGIFGGIIDEKRRSTWRKQKKKHMGLQIKKRKQMGSFL
ncbi:unnamed protein product [Fraxinus pennsylvanica]|uniref:RRM domain-containing protein n=1 Tax=Fraxinus pennsylvanica TaxID=56036 RepID=A0AAD2A7X2_9LAMI|nr:unnamed protein product [Fraxinus pennsylvanica]